MRNCYSLHHLYNLDYCPHLGCQQDSLTTSGYRLVGFYGISTIVGYLMLNPVFTYISNIYDQ